ncbi:FAD:protein FMN transferase [Castellaniella sp. GW247-6E4]|uniref:FAD:protein FMN transferase n=1 Tax=Castellaniella sp. GW247-6E4 TaxID=3140380 RepID=UPI0033163BCD
MPKTCSEAGMSVLSGPTMGTRWSARYRAGVGTDHQALARELEEAVACVDRQMSPWQADSDLMRLNRAAPGEWVALPPDILAVLACALDVGRRSGGAFDAAVGGLVNAWGFGAERDAPDPEAVRQAVAEHHFAHRALTLDRARGRACKQAPMILDLCGIAKGYAVDLMAAVMERHGIGHALLSLDGELRALGGREDGQPWAVALESPRDGVRAARGVIELVDLSVATSGDYRRWFRLGSERLAHSMDGRRVAPVRNAVASVTVLAADCMSADAWATALLVAGPGEGPALAQRQGLEALFLLRREGQLVEWGVGRFGEDRGGPALA